MTAGGRQSGGSHLAEPSTHEQYRADVALYVAAGGEESVQRVITAVQSLDRKLRQWYTRALADLDLSGGEWTVLSRLALADGEPLTPTQLAEAASVAPSSMTHRLDRMSGRGLVERTSDPVNRTRVLVTLTDAGWQAFTAAVRETNVVESDVLRALAPEQREQLAALLEVVISGIDERAGEIEPDYTGGRG